ncbi:MAG: Uma2 family endonuclease [Saprospiraceae bacterium]|nr:Uma2 family endonuclease [Saprospiraceae bacterium]
MGEWLASGKQFTIGEYLEMAAHAREKLEYVNGKITPMPAGTINCNLIAHNLAFGLGLLLDTKPEYRIFSSDQRIWVPAKNSFVYPDALVVCGAPMPAEADPTAITNPLLIVEVLPRSTKEYDRSLKFQLYQTIDSFQEYVLVQQDEPELFHYRREGADLWRIGSVAGLEALLPLKCLGVEVPLARIYRNVEL